MSKEVLARQNFPTPPPTQKKKKKKRRGKNSLKVEARVIFLS
jgi:hypothetical protein